MLDLSGVRRVGVGTTNPVKVAAVKDVFVKLGMFEVDVSGFNSQSHVSEMPSSVEETKLGSYNRARDIMEKGIFDMAFGLEAGVSFDTLESGERVCMLFGWSTIIDSTGFISVGSTGMFQIPNEVAFALQGGAELGPYMSQKTGIDNLKQKGGTIGFLSHGLISRKESFTTSSTQALIPRLNKELYE